MSMHFYRTSDFDWNIPDDLIAHEPLVDRASARLLVCDRARQQPPRHRHVFDLPRLLRAGDLLVLNNSAVLPLRIAARKPTGGQVELLLIKPITSHETDDHVWWEAIIGARKLNLPITVQTHNTMEPIIIDHRIGEKTWAVQLPTSATHFMKWIHQVGETPLPPYIDAATLPEPMRRQRYQTTFATQPGSAAAPTAGLHMTPELLRELEHHGIEHTAITLHVGLGTFLPMTVEDPADHVMHGEWASISSNAADQINRARQSGRRIIAVGTTSLRTLEAFAQDGQVRSGQQWVDLFISPGYQFQIIDGLLTNFHTPRSTLLMLVAALLGYDHLRQAYDLAITERYRFFSFGDAMLIV